MVLHFYSRSIKQVKYKEEKRESLPKILTKSEFKRIPPIRHPRPTLPTTSTKKMLLNTDQLIADVDNSRNRMTIINPPSLSNDQIKEQVKNQWYIYTKIAEWVDCIYKSKFVKEISEKGFIQYYKNLITGLVPDNICSKVCGKVFNYVFEKGKKGVENTMSYVKDKAGVAFNFAGDILHGGWNISKKICNGVQTFFSVSEKNKDSSVFGKVSGYCSSLKNKFLNIFSGNNKNEGEGDSKIIKNEEEGDNKIIKNEGEDDNKIIKNVVERNPPVNQNYILRVLSNLSSSLMKFPKMIYNKIGGIKNLPEIEENKSMIDQNKGSNQDNGTDQNKGSNQDKVTDSIERTNLINQNEGTNNGLLYKFGLNTVFNYLKIPFKPLMYFFRSNEEKSILEINNNQNPIENTSIIEEVDSNTEQQIRSEENDTPIIEEVDSNTEQQIRSKENIPSNLINKSTIKLDEVESKEEFYDVVEDSEEKFYDVVEDSEEKFYDVVEDSEEKFYDVVEEL